MNRPNTIYLLEHVYVANPNVFILYEEAQSLYEIFSSYMPVIVAKWESRKESCIEPGDENYELYWRLAKLSLEIYPRYLWEASVRCADLYLRIVLI